MAAMIDRTEELLGGRIAEIRSEERQLERVLAYLSGDRVGRKPAPPRPRGQGRPRRKVPRGERTQQLLAAIKESPGSSPSELASRIGISSPHVYQLLRRAREQRLIVKAGKGYRLK
jgi:DNA invertase Pin-like site-specific DNA recombinase